MNTIMGDQPTVKQEEKYIFGVFRIIASAGRAVLFKSNLKNAMMILCDVSSLVKQQGTSCSEPSFLYCSRYCSLLSCIEPCGDGLICAELPYYYSCLM